MPTAPKLIAAVLMGALGYYAASLVIPYLPPETRTGLMRQIAAFFGLLVGWRFVGPRCAGGFQVGLGVGLTGAVATALLSLLYFAGYEMVIRSTRFAYDDPFEAIGGMFQIAIEYLAYVLQTDVLGALGLGGLAIGVICYLASRRWS